MHELVYAVRPECGAYCRIPGTSRRCRWFLMTKEEFAKVQEEARRADPVEIRRRAFDRAKKEKIDKEVQKQLADAGFHRCPTCTFPVLDPNDDEFDEKVALIENLASGPIPTCRCRACA